MAALAELRSSTEIISDIALESAPDSVELVSLVDARVKRPMAVQNSDDVIVGAIEAALQLGNHVTLKTHLSSLVTKYGHEKIPLPLHNRLLRLAISAQSANGLSLILDTLGLPANSVETFFETVRKGFSAGVPLWIERGVHVDAREAAGGNTALHVAARRGNVAVMVELVKAGADLTLVNAQRYDRRGKG